MKVKKSRTIEIEKGMDSILSRLEKWGFFCFLKRAPKIETGYTNSLNTTNGTYAYPISRILKIIIILQTGFFDVRIGCFPRFFIFPAFIYFFLFLTGTRYNPLNLFSWHQSLLFNYNLRSLKR